MDLNKNESNLYENDEHNLNNEISADEYFDEKIPLIYKLNDDCMLHIFSFLDMYELFKIKKVSKRFFDLAEASFRPYTKLSLKLRTLNLEYLDDIFDMIVIPNVKSLHIAGGSAINTRLQYQLIKDIPKCKQLTELNLMYFNLQSFILQSFYEIFQNLTSLHLNRCEIDDNKMLYIVELPNLTKLNLAGNAITGKYLPQLKSKLSELYLDFCQCLEYSYFKEYLLNNINQLVILDITFNSKLYEEKNILEWITKTQPNIYDLRIGEIKNNNLTELTNLKKLKNLTCHQILPFIRVNLDSLVIGLASTHFSILTYLDISFCEVNLDGQEALTKFNKFEILKLKRLKMINGSFDFIKKLSCFDSLNSLDISYCNINDDHCLEIIRRAPNLIYLNVEYSTVSDKLLEKVVKFLNRQKEWKNKLHLNVRETSLKKQHVELSFHNKLFVEFSH